MHWGLLTARKCNLTVKGQELLFQGRHPPVACPRKQNPDVQLLKGFQEHIGKRQIRSERETHTNPGDRVVTQE